MKKEKLTAYDNFIINKNQGALQTSVENDTESSYISPSYAKYIEEQLRRTQPSEERVMTQSEYEKRSSSEKEDMWNALACGKKTKENSSAKSIQFKKFGKILLCAYVIIMLCLALIVIVKTTSTDNLGSADASDVPQNVSSGIEKMQEEESEKNNGWFDSLCDSLK